MPYVVVHEAIEISRPLDEVRSHFFDIEYHAARPVHPKYQFVVLSRAEDAVTYHQISHGLLGGRDLLVTARDASGNLRTECTEGPNAGLKVAFSFEPAKAEGRVACRATFELPTRAPWPLRGGIGWFLRRAVREALHQDKQDLEANAYVRMMP
jgi:hypothetical protein